MAPTNCFDQVNNGVWTRKSGAALALMTQPADVQLTYHRMYSNPTDEELETALSENRKAEQEYFEQLQQFNALTADLKTGAFAPNEELVDALGDAANAFVQIQNFGSGKIAHLQTELVNEKKKVIELEATEKELRKQNEQYDKNFKAIASSRFAANIDATTRDPDPIYQDSARSPGRDAQDECGSHAHVPAIQTPMEEADEIITQLAHVLKVSITFHTITEDQELRTRLRKREVGLLINAMKESEQQRADAAAEHDQELNGLGELLSKWKLALEDKCDEYSEYRHQVQMYKQQNEEQWAVTGRDFSALINWASQRYQGHNPDFPVMEYETHEAFASELPHI